MYFHKITPIDVQDINPFLRRRVKAAGECSCGARIYWGDDPHSAIEEHLKSGDSYMLIHEVESKAAPAQEIDLSDPNMHPSVEPERVTWPPVEPADPRFTRTPLKKDKTSTVGDLQLTAVYTESGKLLMRVFHVPSGMSMSVWAKESETNRMLRVRVLRMMAAALRAESLGGMA